MATASAAGCLWDFQYTYEVRDAPLGSCQAKEIRDDEYHRMEQLKKDFSSAITGGGLISVADFWEQAVGQHAQNLMIQKVGSPRTYTFQDMDWISNRMAHCLLRQTSLKVNDVGAVMVENGAEIVQSWLSLCKIGVTSAMINTHLETDALAHALHVSKAKVAIVSIRYWDVWHQAKQYFQNKGFPCEVWWMIGENDVPGQIDLSRRKILDRESYIYPTTSIDRRVRYGLDTKSPLFLIFTSGTTGPSKAAIFNHNRSMKSAITSIRMGLKSNDIYYNPLPMYHGNGGVVAVLGTIYSGCCMAIRERFSTSNYWKDIQRYKCTAGIYIGELWTYLYNTPVCEEEKNNTLRVIVGNGLRAEIWNGVRERFGITRICEFWGMSECPLGVIRGNTKHSHWSKPGAVGYKPPEVRRTRDGQDVLIEYDFSTSEPKRYYSETEGVPLCRTVPCNEPGLLLYELDETLYDGYIYNSKEASNKTLLRDVFRNGDLYYITGDILRVDEEGWMYFCDRSGDTFRWKGENVSTNEVSGVIIQLEWITAANVYGVEVPGHGGRAGMANISVTNDEDVNLLQLYNYMQSRLPKYAQPLFLRLNLPGNSVMQTTSTHKFQKFSYQKEGFNPNKIDDPLYFCDHENERYVVLRNQMYNQIFRKMSKL